MRATVNTAVAADVGARLRLLRRVAAESVNATASVAQTDSVRRITDRLNLRREYVEDKFSLRRATPSNPVATVSAVDRPVQLRQYDARQEFSGAARAGISVQVLRAGARRTIRSAFFAPLKQGGIGVFSRVGVSRTPIRVLFAPSPGQMFATISPDVSEQALRRLLEDMSRRTDGALSATNVSASAGRVR